MKIFEAIHFILISGFIFGMPVAASMRPYGQEFSWIVALKQAGILTLILLVLLMLNFFVAEIFSRRTSRRRAKSEHET